MLKHLIIIFTFLAGCSAPIDTPIWEAKNGCDDGLLLLGTAYSSFEEFKNCVDVEYTSRSESKVTLYHHGQSQITSCDLSSGISENDLIKANSSTLFDKLKILYAEPLLIADRIDMQRAYLLSRRRPVNFGANDIAFYDLAKAIMKNIDRENIDTKYKDDFSEKGFINTFNHFVSQAFIASLFSKRLADFIADTHELGRLPELVTGEFSESQLKDLHNGPVDNYVDLLNNEWGQEFGISMKEKYDIKRTTNWTTELLADYLNEIQSYSSRAFDLGFEPFRTTDYEVTRFSYKLNAVMSDFTSHSENLF